MPRAAIIFNPTAGRGESATVAARARAHLEGRGWEASELGTAGAGHARELAGGLGNVDLLVVAGGDGTLREAAEGLRGAGHGTPLGIVPLGNSNVVAREFGIPLDVSGALELLTQGTARPMDAMSANGRVALAMVGVGYDALVTRWVHMARVRRPWSRWYRLHADSLYAALGLAALFHPRPPRLALTADGERATALYRAVSLCNTEVYAKGWSMTPGADPSDGRLDYQARKRAAFPFTLWSYWRALGRRPSPAWVSDHGAARTVVLEASRPFRWQADGDPMGRTRRLEVEVLPAYLSLVAPPAAGSPGLTPA